MNMNNIFAVIEKYEKLDDDVILISGIASSETMDNQNEVVKAQAMKDAIPDYLSLGGTGALREMHQSKAAGSVFKAEVTEDGKTHIEARVVDKEACKKIEQGVYKGFSIGGKVLKKEGNVITKVKLTEISLVDRPCNPESLFSMYKCDDIDDESIEKIAERSEVNPKEGESKYGDVKFADEKNNKYPIDTEAHIRAAWNYIHQKRNAAKYSGKDGSTIKSKIVSAWKRVIGGEPPSAEAKKNDYSTPLMLSNGLCMIGQLSSIISELSCLQTCMEYEEQMEMDKSTLPNEVTLAIKNLYDILVRMAEEEAKEFNDNDEIKMTDNTKDLSKADPVASDVPGASFNTDPTSVIGAVNAAQSAQKYPQELSDINQSINEIKAALISHGYDLTPVKAQTVDNWNEKSEKTEDLSKSLSKISEQITNISERMEKLESTPLPTNSVLKKVSGSGQSLSKSEDASGKELSKVDRSRFSNVQLDTKDFEAMDVIRGMYG